jgi:hypothetical protein
MPAPLTGNESLAVIRDGHVVLEKLTEGLGGASISAQGDAPLALLL